MALRFRPLRPCSCPKPLLANWYCGACLSQSPAKHVAKIKTFLVAVAVLCPGVATAEQYGRLRAQLAKAGTPIPENDIWIAALALEHQLLLAARDAHFDLIAGLSVLKW